MQLISTSTIRRSLAVAAVALLVVPGVSALAGTTSSSAKPTAEQSPVLVGPTLQILTFGNNIGLPLGCQLATSAIGAGAAEYGFGSAVGPVVQAGNNGCTMVSAQGAAGLEQATTASQPLSALNPTVNPMIGQAADSVTMVGTEYGEELSPFGPTVAGLGGTINFFQGK